MFHSHTPPIHPLVRSQVWRRWQRGSVLSTALWAAEVLYCPRSDTMSNNDDIRYCHRCSYVFLKFILFAYSIIFWVSSVIVAEERALCLLHAGTLTGCVCVFLNWSCVCCSTPYEKKKHRCCYDEKRMKLFLTGRVQFCELQLWSDRCWTCGVTQCYSAGCDFDKRLCITVWPHPPLHTFTPVLPAWSTLGKHNQTSKRGTAYVLVFY